MHSTSPITRKDRARFRAIQDLGCLCCRLRGLLPSPAEIHHLISGNRRRGHQATIGLCPWHHRGVPRAGFTQTGMTSLYGQSLALGSVPFHSEFGSDDELLAFQNKLIAAEERLWG